ncbi:MAG: hypothetical protein BWZ08_02752 [candidate division BRC1 bacterium ADurb.BinA292]|nr:MAG: hypothetical protein BWZ08_02752 [candidate division BRC1 bacterium ADurb.BinA292]
MPQQGAGAGLAHARNFLEQRAQIAPAAQFAVIGDAEAVGFVAQALEQVERGRSRFERDGVLPAGQEEALLGAIDFVAAVLDAALGHADQRDAGQAEVLHDLDGDGELALAAVDDDEAGGRFGSLGDAAKPAGQHFVQGAEIILTRQRLDAETAVARLVGFAAAERDHRADRGEPLNRGDIEAFDGVGRGLEVELFADFAMDFLDRLLAGEVLLEQTVGVFAGGLDEAEFFAALGGDDLDARFAPFGEP